MTCVPVAAVGRTVYSRLEVVLRSCISWTHGSAPPAQQRPREALTCSFTAVSHLQEELGCRLGQFTEIKKIKLRKLHCVV